MTKRIGQVFAAVALLVISMQVEAQLPPPFNATRLAVDGTKVLLVGPGGAQLRDISAPAQAVLSTKPGGESEFGAGDIDGNTAYLGQIVTRGNPTRFGVTVAPASAIDRPTATALIPSMPRALMAVTEGVWAAYNDGTRGRLRRYSATGAEMQTIDLGGMVADAAVVPGGIAVLLFDGTARVMRSDNGAIAERLNFGGPAGSNGRIAASATHVAATGFADGVRVVRREANATPAVAGVCLGARSVALVGDIVLAGCAAVGSQNKPNRVERWEISTGKALEYIPTTSLAWDIVPYRDGYLLADQNHGVTVVGASPPPTSPPSPPATATRPTQEGAVPCATVQAWASGVCPP